LALPSACLAVGVIPWWNCRPNFGGSKTHSMLALYHMAGETAVQDLPGLDQLLADQFPSRSTGLFWWAQPGGRWTQ